MLDICKDIGWCKTNIQYQTDLKRTNSFLQTTCDIIYLLEVNKKKARAQPESSTTNEILVIQTTGKNN